MRRLHQRVNALFVGDIGNAQNLTATQFAILSTIAMAPHSEQSEIANLAHFDVATTSGVTVRLETMGLVIRTRSTRSRNGWCVTLSEAGHAAMAKANLSLQDLPDRMFYMLNAAERHEFLRLLSRVAEVSNSYTKAKESGQKVRRTAAVPAKKKTKPK